MPHIAACRASEWPYSCKFADSAGFSGGRCLAQVSPFRCQYWKTSVLYVAVGLDCAWAGATISASRQSDANKLEQVLMKYFIDPFFPELSNCFPTERSLAASPSHH